MTSLDYGIIGNGRSCALVSKNGSIDWCCLADFDSPSVFGALLDPTMGGCFAVVPSGNDWEARQSYLSHTNILRTHIIATDGEFEIIDFMPCYRVEHGKVHCPPDVMRVLRPLRGSPQIKVLFNPRLGYAEHPTRLLEHPKYIKAETSSGDHESVYLYSNLESKSVLGGTACQLNEPKYLLLSYDQKLGEVDLNRVELELELTKAYWMAWAARTTRSVSYPQAVERSALVLKLLSYRPSGAILAAATTSLPEVIGESRNWDYRYCWIRDASMTMRTLVNLQHHDVARRFFDFVLDVVPYKRDHIQVMYGIRGQRELHERTLDWLSGYEGSRPVRVGNAAWDQQQNDIYGVLLDALYQGFLLFQNQPEQLEALWTMTRGVVRHIESRWRMPDQGIWEIRGAPQHFTYSKVMCWVGLDRAARIASLIGMSEYAAEYAAARDEIRAEILDRAWNVRRQAFVQAYGSEHLDASLLLLCRLGFVESNDPRWVTTVTAIYDELCRDGFMYRYKNADDFGLPSTSFIPCTFWMIQAWLTVGRDDLACELLGNIMSRGNHLGLFSEDLDFASHRLLGNFPQGYSHLALIDTVLTLDRIPLLADRSMEPSMRK